MSADETQSGEIPAPIRGEILQRLARVEQSEQVRIVLAVESGSRAWGFASPDSDYDVRFIYARPRDWYVRVDLEEQRDVIEYPIVDEIDLNGWDVRKALQLFWRCNPTLIEWIQSPLQYLTAGEFVGRARQLLPSVYSCEKGIYHYRSMAKTTYRAYLREEQVPHKKYFYALRPLLAIRWIEAYRTAPPIELQSLLGLLEGETVLLDDIHALIETKRVSPEMGRAPPIVSLHRFIEAELERLERLLPDRAPRSASMDDLNALFHATLAELED